MGNLADAAARSNAGGSRRWMSAVTRAASSSAVRLLPLAVRGWSESSVANIEKVSSCAHVMSAFSCRPKT
eukprot:1365106-Prymnesium_polylepis.1